MIVLLVVIAVVVTLWRLRRRRKSVLAGLDAAKPTYSLAPPRRWSTTGRDHRL